MKKYTINVHFDVVCTVEVEAQNETEAKELAENIAWGTDASEFCDFTLTDSCVTYEEEIS